MTKLLIIHGLCFFRSMNLVIGNISHFLETDRLHCGKEWVDMEGLGWTLLAGGCISRTTHGFPDDAGCYNNTTKAKGIFALDNNSRQMRYALLNRENEDYILENPAGDNVLDKSLCENYNLGLSDMANDVFQISFLGKMGTFIYVENLN